MKFVTNIFYLLCLSFASSLTTGNLRADEKLFGIACRSVHLGFPAQECQAFYNEIEVRKSASGTYFMVCGWDQGYFGIQELANGKKVILFSVWDPGDQNDPNSVKEDSRVKLVDHEPRVRIGRFGGEGTGGQSFFDYDWKPGVRYRFMVRSQRSDKRTVYTGYFFHPEESKWLKLVSFSTLTPRESMTGLYSFVEDFQRDRKSTQNLREAAFGTAWFQTLDGQWHVLPKARFTADSNPAKNIDSRVDGAQMVLATGGDITNAGIKLRSMLELDDTESMAAPSDLPKE